MKDPLRIVLQRLKDQDAPKPEGYTLEAKVQHRSGILGVNLFYRSEGDQLYQRLKMELIDAKTNIYSATIPDFVEDGEIEYYVQGIANLSLIHI